MAAIQQTGSNVELQTQHVAFAEHDTIRMDFNSAIGCDNTTEFDLIRYNAFQIDFVASDRSKPICALLIISFMIVEGLN